MKHVLASLIFYLFAFPLEAAPGPIPPLSNDALFPEGQQSELELKQKRYQDADKMDKQLQESDFIIQRQEEGPSQVKIKEKNEDKEEQTMKAVPAGIFCILILAA